MKKLKLSCLLFVTLFVSILLLNAVRLSPATKASNPSSEQEASATSSPEPKAQVKQASKTSLSTKHDYPSRLLQSKPNSPEIPYYLLGNVNDPYDSIDWGHSAVQAHRAWDLSSGTSSTVVAVIDTGFALNHEDLTNKWFVNNGETGTTQAGDTCWTGTTADKSTNNCDDDGNGYIDDWRGYDFANNDNNPAAGTVNPTGVGTNHGTMVAGVIAAEANNSKGSSGIDQAAKIMPLQVFDDDGNAYTSDIVAAIDYATSNGAKVINLSLGSNQYDSLMQSAVQYAVNHGVFVVVASGNCALNDQPICSALTGPGRMTYPALYTESFAVGSTDNNDTRSDFSSYGPELDITAPGGSVGPMPAYTAANQITAYASASGTSFASPMVAGIASLLIGQNPSITPAQLQFILTESADKVSSMSGSDFTNQYGYGRVNAHRATLLGLAKTQDSLLGSRDLSPREAAIGHIWRATTGSINSDESLLVGCRVFDTQACSVTVENGSTYRFTTNETDKTGTLQYIFIKGSSVPAGSWILSVHNNDYATKLITLTR